MKFNVSFSWSKIKSSSEQTEAHRHSVSFERALFFFAMAVGWRPSQNVIHHRWKFIVRVADWTNDILSRVKFCSKSLYLLKKKYLSSPPSLDSTVHDRWNAAEGVLKWTWSCWLQVVLLMCEAVFCFCLYLLFFFT